MKYAGMPMGMWVLFAGSFQKQLTAVLGYDAATAKAITKKAKPQYRQIICRLPEFEKADRFKMNIVNCAMLGAFILSMPQRPEVDRLTDYYAKSMMTKPMQWFCRKSGKSKFTPKDIAAMKATAALKAAEDGSWVILETQAKDKAIDEHIEFNDPGKTVELKMNGYTLTNSGNPTLTVENGTLKITGDAVINQTGGKEMAAPAVRVTGGTLIFDGRLNATGASGKPAVLVTGGTLRLKAGDVLNCVLPLGNGFTMPTDKAQKVLLVGGGVGVAPLLYFGQQIKEMGGEPTFLLGARTATDLLELDLFKAVGRVFVTTEDASAGEKGFVTNHSVLSQERFDQISTCGPKPMMMAVARYAKAEGINCEVSLENKMACGVGACLCCVEKTTEGNVCVCKEGPVLNINKLSWQI